MSSLAAATLTMTLAVAQPASADPALTYEGHQLSVPEMIGVVYDAGAREEQQLVHLTSIAIAESSLYTRLRHWHPELGYRPVGDALGVQGPDWARNAAGAQAQADRGLFQINSYWWPQHSDAAADDPATAARVIMDISKGGTDFTSWDTHNNGAAQRHWDAEYNGWPAVRPLVRDFLAGRSSTSTRQASASTPAPAPVAGAERTHTMTRGQSLFEVATAYYGDGNLWSRLASHNQIPVPDKVEMGTVIRLP